ncbi:glycosyltransferase family 2 protein [Terrimonas alba]|uniref:glycosyltransferase family 2 protein n=1 Tax=Terrimonas alba TaxID=3349636 RepID=UPI0035F41524
MTLIFWSCLIIIFYTYIGYGVLLYALVRFRRVIKGNRLIPDDAGNLPSMTVIVAAYNEEAIIEKKILNTISLAYPAGKCFYIFVTDGSDDNTASIISRYPQIKLLHDPRRLGKINAVHRAMKEVNTDIVVFTDANTILNKDALISMARHYTNVQVGAVAGEKRVAITENSDATAGEGFYWKYESFLKKLDSELHSVMGAAGELFSIRTKLYQPVNTTAILDDFLISMMIAGKNYRVVYEPGAYALENSSANIKEELKRKIRIAAGGIQSVIWLRNLLNPLVYPILSFQYISHRVLRWTIAPFCLLALFLINIYLAFQRAGTIYDVLLVAQIVFYTAAIIGWQFEKKEIKVKTFFIPFYFCVMNYAVIRGIGRFYAKTQSATWEKAERKI